MPWRYAGAYLCDLWSGSTTPTPPSTETNTPTPSHPPTPNQHVADLIDQHLALADDVRPPLSQLFRLEEQLAPVRRQLRLDSVGPLVEGLEEVEEEMGNEDDGGDLDQGPRGRKSSGVEARAARVPPSPRSSRG